MQQIYSSFLLVFFYWIGLATPTLMAQGPPPGVGSGNNSGTTTPTGGNSGGGILNRDVTNLDTFDAQYFFYTNPFFITDPQDTLLDQQFGQPDPAYWGDFAFANLGNLGSPMTPLVYESKIHDGLNIGFNSFDQYYLKKEELRFYKLKKPIINAIYNQGRTQDDQHFQIEFTTEFGKGLSYTIHHRRINHKGVFSLSSQLARNYALNTGFWYHHPSGKYQSFLTFNNNSTLHLENGGVDTTALNATNLEREETVPTRLAQDTTRYQMRIGTYAHYYHLRSPVPKPAKDTSVLSQFPLLPKDSLNNEGKKLAKPPGILNADGSLKIPTARDSIIADSLARSNALLQRIPNDTTGLDSVLIDSLIIDQVTIDSAGMDSLLLTTTAQVDSTLTQDSLQIIKKKQKKNLVYYDPNRLFPKRRQVSIGHEINVFGGFYKYANLNPEQDSSYYGDLYLFNQGLQYRVGHRGVTNSFFIVTSSINKDKKEKTQIPRDFLKAGIRQSYHSISQNGDTTKFNNISIFGNLTYLPFEKLKLEAATAFYLTGYNAGDFFLDGSLDFNLEKIGRLTAYASTQSHAPFYIQNTLNISAFQLYNNDFKKVLETRIGGTLAVPKTKTEISFNLQILDNYIYYDTLALATQADAIFSIPQFIIKQPIKLGNFHLDNIVVVQNSNDNILALPKVFSKHSLYFEGKIFKESLLLKIGAEGIFYTDYRARKYQPLIGQFYNSNEELKYFPQIDPFISAKKDRWRIYFRMQNAASALISPDQLLNFRTPDYPIPYRVFRFGLAMILIN